MEKLRLESWDLPNVTGSLAVTAFLNSLVVLWLPRKRKVKGVFVLILLIKTGLAGVGGAGHPEPHRTVVSWLAG